MFIIKFLFLPDRDETELGDNLVEALFRGHVHQAPPQTVVREYQEHLGEIILISLSHERRFLYF